MDLQQLIEANAAKKLVLPPGRKPAQEIGRYKNFLKVETHRLKIRHRAGAAGRLICQARAVVLDVLICHLVRAVWPLPGAGMGGPGTALAVVAIGGYGRGELNPFSDVDLLFLHDGTGLVRGKPNAFLGALTEGVLYTLWDIGLKVGHSVRSIEDCVKVANHDMQAKTALIEARWITGDEALFQQMQRVVEARSVQGFEEAYIAARLADQRARRAKFGDSACMQEPHIKNGCGGLRDYQNLLWMAFFKYRIRSLAELEQRGQLSQTEYEQLEAAYDFLLRVRNELHYQVNRATDTLTRAIQPAVAFNLGYTDRSVVRRIEDFMRDLYRHLRNIYLITRTLEQRLALMPARPPQASWRNFFRPAPRKTPSLPFDGFQFQAGEIRPSSSRVFREQPRRLMRAFLYAQQRGCRLHPDLAQLIRNELGLVNQTFLHDAHVRETFLELLNQRGNVSSVLRPMHETGLLGRYLPEFGKLTCLVQHEFYHRYTADEHTLVCVEMLDQVWHARQPPFVHFSELFKKIEQPYLLYLALLLHDAGRANRRSPHTDGSLRAAQRVARRLALDAVTNQTLRLVIEHHLSLIQVSQRRDLDDPAVGRKLAVQLKTPEHLMLLMLHTFADSLGTSAELWTDFKASLLWTLYDRTMQCLVGGPDADREREKRQAQLAQTVRKLMPRFLGQDELESHWTHLPPRYFQVHSAQEILADLVLVNRFMHLQCNIEKNALEAVISWQDEPDRGYVAASICTWDRPGLFRRFAGVFTASGMNILSAKIFSRSDGIVIDTFFVTDAPTGALPKRESREKFEKLLRQVLTGHADLDSLVAKTTASRARMLYDEAEPLPTQVRFDNQSSETYTVIDVETGDRVGLLYAVARIISELELNIALAKICTEKGAAMDSFYIQERSGGKVESAQRQEVIKDRLLLAIQALERPASNLKNA